MAIDMKAFQDQLEFTGIIPVIKLEDTSKAVELAKALRAGGINAAEVTFRAAGADKVISDMTKAFPDMLVGAGTVTTIEQCDAAIAAGAKFCVAPGLNAKVVRHCLDKGVPFAPGVANSSQIEEAMELGLDFVKFFPAEQAGGLAYIKSISAPYSNMKFMPTGGVNEKNLNTYLGFKKIICCGGSWIVPGDLVKNGDWAGITSLCRTAVNKMLDFQIVHVGVNCANEDEAKDTTAKFAKMFGWEQKVGNSSVFAGTAIECMKSPFKGKNGHIAVATNSLRRAVYQLNAMGIETEKKATEIDADTKAVYLKDEFSGFAVHLVERK